MATRRPPRIAGFSYIGPHAYFLTICTSERRRSFENALVADRTIGEFLRTAHSYRFADIAHCLMPDHFHALVEGTDTRSDLRRFVAMFKQRSSFRHVHDEQRALWQEGYYEHVLRSDSAKISVTAYVVQNPVRAGLCASVCEYPYVGSALYTLEELIAPVQLAPNRS